MIYRDVNGIEPKPGDLLKAVNPASPWQYLVCFDRYGKAQIRDLNANNLGQEDMDEYKVIGHYSNHPGVLDEEDLEYYFGIRPKSSEGES